MGYELTVKDAARLVAAELGGQLAALEDRVACLEQERVRVRTWAQVIDELEMLVCDVQVSGISDVLQKLAEEQRDV
jgi:predicted rRNA methylase YqxC with S4 and FtsJ domains